MARPKKDKKKEEARIAAKKKRLDDEREITDAAKGKEPIKKMTVDDRLNRLEFIARKMAHFKGVTKIVTEAGLEAWVPGAKDMTRWKNEIKDK